jgi:glutamyl/glutaminyl-tRNA synthetase
MDVADLVEAFDTLHLSRKPSAFDEEQLLALNAWHIRRMSSTQLLEAAGPFLETCGEALGEPAVCEGRIEIVQPHLTTLADLRALLDVLRPEGGEVHGHAEALLREEGSLRVLKALARLLERMQGTAEQQRRGEVPELDIEHLMTRLEALTGVEDRELFPIVRAALLGMLRGPRLEEMLPLIGAGECLRRARRALEKVGGDLSGLTPLPSVE